MTYIEYWWHVPSTGFLMVSLLVAMVLDLFGPCRWLQPVYSIDFNSWNSKPQFLGGPASPVFSQTPRSTPQASASATCDLSFRHLLQVRSSSIYIPQIFQNSWAIVGPLEWVYLRSTSPISSNLQLLSDSFQIHRWHFQFCGHLDFHRPHKGKEAWKNQALHGSVQLWKLEGPASVNKLIALHIVFWIFLIVFECCSLLFQCFHHLGQLRWPVPA